MLLPMTRETLALILETEGVKPIADVHRIAESTEATLFVATHGDVLPVPRVIAVELRDKYLCVATVKAERFFFVYEDILGLKIASSSQSRDHSAGFGR